MNDLQELSTFSHEINNSLTLIYGQIQCIEKTYDTLTRNDHWNRMKDDFSSLFDNHKSEKERAAAVETLKSEFGKRFIVLPNVGYGDWESAIFDYKYDLTQQQRDSIIYEAARETPMK